MKLFIISGEGYVSTRPKVSSIRLHHEIPIMRLNVYPEATLLIDGLYYKIQNTVNSRNG